MNDLSKLKIRVTGPQVGEARLAASDLAEIIRRTQQALQRVGQVLYGQDSLGKGRKKKDIEMLCQLFVVAWESGSSIVSLELARPPDQLSFFGYVGEQSLQAFLDGMEAIASGPPDRSALPRGFDVGVLETCDALGKVLDHGIDEVAFHSEPTAGLKRVVYDRNFKTLVERLLEQPVDLVIPYDFELAKTWARVCAQAKRQGRRLEAGDAWIVATAVHRSIPLWTHDRGQAEVVISGLQVISYVPNLGEQQ